MIRIVCQKHYHIFANGQNLQDMVQYICHSDSKHVVNQATTTLDGIVNSVRKDQGVDMLYEVRVLEENRRVREEAYAEKDNFYIPIIKEKDSALADKETEIASMKTDLADKVAEIQRLRAQLANIGIADNNDNAAE